MFRAKLCERKNPLFDLPHSEIVFLILYSVITIHVKIFPPKKVSSSAPYTTYIYKYIAVFESQGCVGREENTSRTDVCVCVWVEACACVARGKTMELSIQCLLLFYNTYVYVRCKIFISSKWWWKLIAPICYIQVTATIIIKSYTIDCYVNNKRHT